MNQWLAKRVGGFEVSGEPVVSIDPLKFFWEVAVIRDGDTDTVTTTLLNRVVGCGAVCFSCASALSIAQSLYPQLLRAFLKCPLQVLPVSLLTGSHLKVHHNPAKDRRLQSQRWLLQTRYIQVLTSFNFILVPTLPRWMRVYTILLYSIHCIC